MIEKRETSDEEIEWAEDRLINAHLKLIYRREFS